MRTICIIGDSLAQSYPDEPVGQCGWGSFLFGALAGETPSRSLATQGEGTLFRGRDLLVANFAKAGRSTRTFLEEQRTDAPVGLLGPGDILLVNFGHNDADRNRAERFVTLDGYRENLLRFAYLAYQKDALPVFVTPLPFRGKVAGRSAEAEAVCADIPSYREAMVRCARRQGISVVDLGEHPCKDGYREDGVHLVEHGARYYAKAVATVLGAMMSGPADSKPT